MSLIALLAAVVLGAEAPPPSADEERVEHVEVRAPLPLGEDIAAFATTLDLQGLAGRGEDLSDVLRRVPGARVREYGGLGNYATVSLRASTAEQVKVLVDGVPQNRALGGPVDLSYVPATQVDRITVYRGFAPAGYGPGGVGGLVDIRTRAPDGKPAFHADLVVGELDTQRLAAGTSMRAAGGALRIGVEALQSEGDFEYDDGDGEARRTNNDVEQAAIFVRQVWDDVAGGSLGLGLRVQRRERGVPGLSNHRAELARLEEDLDDLSGSWRLPGRGPLDGLDLLFDAFRSETVFDDPGGEIGVGTGSQTTRVDGGGLVGTAYASAARHRLSLRTELRDEAARIRKVRPAGSSKTRDDRRQLSFTGEDMVSFGRWTIAPSLSYQHVRDETDSGDATDDAWTGKLGAAFRPRAGLALRGSIGRFHRTPSLRELYAERGSVTGNPDLRPEDGRSVELGIDWDAERDAFGFGVESVAFYRRVDDLIWILQTSQAVSQPRNIAEAEVFGVETSLSFDLPRSLRLDASLTLQRAEDVSDGFTGGQPLPYHADTSGWLGASWKPGRFEARWELTYVGENSTTQIDLPQFRVPERWIHDLGAAYTLRRGLQLGVDVRNVLDRKTLDVARYPLPGRVVFLHVGWAGGAS
ncbi:MAG: TonB-dependent receptor [bacterium]|nr:TonB-dependent receptor [bacterium]